MLRGKHKFRQKGTPVNQIDSHENSDVSENVFKSKWTSYWKNSPHLITITGLKTSPNL